MPPLVTPEGFTLELTTGKVTESGCALTIRMNPCDHLENKYNLADDHFPGGGVGTPPCV